MQAAALSILDFPEQRFPISLDAELPKIRGLYQAATRNQWNPETDVPWDLLDADSFDDEHRNAARMWWSRRGWANTARSRRVPPWWCASCRIACRLSLRFSS